MSDIPRIGQGIDPFAQDPDDETAAALRGALFREAERVAPSSDGLQRIQREIHARQSQRRAPRFARLAPALTAAAAVVVLAVAGAVAVRLNQPSATGGGVQPAGSSTATPEAPQGRVPVYFVGTQGGRKWLFREFWSTRAVSTDDKVADAVTGAVNGRPVDVDYDAPLFQGGRESQASATVTPSLITVTLTAAMVSRHDVSPADAQLALQQVVWTATAAAGSGKADTPVLIRVDQGNQSLFGSIPLNREFARTDFSSSPQAPLWISSVVETTDVGHDPITVAGDAVVGDGGSVTWTLTRNGVEVGSGDATLGTATGARATRTPWSLDPNTGGKAGSYLLTVTLHPGDGTGLSTSAEWKDTRSFVIQ